MYLSKESYTNNYYDIALDHSRDQDVFKLK
jgi:hypothetical protein